MANDISRREATLFTLSAQFTFYDINKKPAELQIDWQEAFNNTFFVYYEILKELAKKI